MREEELNDDNFEEIESYSLTIERKGKQGHLIESYFLVEINRQDELLWCNKECLSFADAIKLQDQIDNVDFTNTCFKPFRVPVFNLFPTIEDFTEMMEYFDINKAKISELKANCNHYFNKVVIGGKKYQKCNKCDYKIESNN